mmetsp:Transcript_96922/g.211909  ORF Transcript_96922/g.211909 Transcript_96922/m.211909 type:complete len:696 (-) Transcript_96922:403-2490(-)
MESAGENLKLPLNNNNNDSQPEGPPSAPTPTGVHFAGGTAERDVEEGASPPRSGAGSFRNLRRSLSHPSHEGGNEITALSMEWTDVCFSIGNKAILKNITGVLEPGHLTAVLGPSGSGKSTLLNLLGGRQRTTGASGEMPFSGDVSAAGCKISLNQFKSQIAYVMQDDRLMATETVRECINFSAMMRRPGTSAERQALVGSMLDTLGLRKCADTIAGNALLKGISGGERKRCSVGIELITDPKLIFLDEPLSGLDSYAAYTLVQALKDLAESGVPVLCTVHQPSSEIFAMFDDVVVLHDGEVVYHGPVQSLAHHFDHWEPCPANFNPADHVMFLLQKEAEQGSQRIAEMKTYWPQSELGKALRARAEGLRHAATAVSSTSSLAGQLNNVQEGARLGFFTQLVVLVQREARGTIRNKGVLIARLGMSAFLAILYAWLFAGSADQDKKSCYGDPETFAGEVSNCQGSFQAHYGTLVSLSIATMMGASQPVLLTFPAERPVFLREYTARQYGVVPYFLSKSLVELPVVLASQVVMYLISFWIMGLQGNFAFLILIAWALGITSSSLCLIIGCGVAAGEKAIQFGPLALVPQMLFSGLFLPVSKIPDSLQWVKYLCPLKYAINLATLVEFQSVKDAFDECQKAPCPNEYAGLKFRMNAIKTQGVDWDDLVPDMAILAGLYVGFRVIACILLWRKGRYVF